MEVLTPSLRDFTEKAAAVWPHGQDCKKQPDSEFKERAQPDNANVVMLIIPLTPKMVSREGAKKMGISFSTQLVHN